jgi:hypothetical protein
VKRPSFQFYPSDWRKDMALQSCCVAARGLWIDVMCIAHECEPYGHLTVNGKPMTAAQVGRHTGLTERECAKLLDELEQAGVLSRTEQGAIYSRRMVRDEDLRQRRAEGGKAGSEHGHKGAEHGHKGGRPKSGRGVSEHPLDPPPSSSSSSSSSISSSDEEEKTPPAALPAAKAPAKKVPADVQLLLDEGVPLQVAEDWLAVRKKHRAPLTATAMDGLRRECIKAGMTATQAVTMAAERGWRGFFADWAQRDRAGPAARGGQRQTAHSGFDKMDYSQGVNDDGSFT